MKDVAVRASAGSGKTYELAVQFVARLALGADPASIVATTFTRKAAGEILDRVIQRLASAAASPEKADVLAREVHHIVPELAGELPAGTWIELLARCCRTLDRVNIGTIDALFVGALTGFLHEAGMVTTPAMTDERSPEAASIRDRALQETLAGMSPVSALEMLRDISGGQLSRSVLGRMEPAVSQLLPLASVTEPAAWATLAPTPAPDRGDLEDAIAHVEQIASECNSRALARGLLKSVSDARALQWEAVLTAGASGKVGLRGIATSSLTAPAESVPTYNRVPIPDQAVTALQVMTQAAAHHVTLRLQSRCRATRALLDQYREIHGGLLRQADMLLFDELPRMLLDATQRVGPSEIAYRLGLSVRHLLLDEFQDTSRPQWTLLQRLFIGAGADLTSPRPSMFCVGDSKQAIYGWRGGSAAIFDGLDREVPGLTWAIRSTSYRSSQIVLDLVNEVFGHMERWDCLDLYPDLQARWKGDYVAHRAHAPLPGHTLVRRHSDADDADEGLLDDDTDASSPVSGRSPFDAWVTAATADIAREDPASSIGVLVRRNRTAAEITLGLQSLGIAASLDGPGALADDPATGIILSALMMADHPDSTAEAFHVATSPLREPIGLLDTSPASRLRASLRVRRMLAANGYAGVIAHWSRALAPVGDERTGRRLTLLTEAAAAYEPQATQRPSDFVRWVRSQSVSEQSDERIRVMTVHQAKGLEFDIVVLPELHAPIHAVRPPVVELRDDDQDRPVRVVPYPSEGARLVSNDLQRALLQHREREVADALNLLYVAMTRPRHALHILLPARKPSAKGPEPPLPVRPDSLIRAALGCETDGPIQVLYERGDPRWRSALTARTGRSKQRACEVIRPLISPITFLRSSRRRIWPDAAPSRLDEAGTRTARDLLRLDTSAMSYGVLIHAWFQSIEWLDDGVPDDDRLVRLGRIALPSESDSWLRERIPAFRELLTRPAVVQALTKPPWPLSLWRERPFVARIGDALVRGRMDRVVIRPSDEPGPRAVITDIKSDQIDADAVQPRAAGYHSQMRSYAEALSQMLGTPLREIDAQLLFVTPGVLHEVPLT